MSELLGETVIDLLSGQRAEVVGYDSGKLHCYRIEFLDAPASEGSPYEAGHSAWRLPAEIEVLLDSQR